MKPTFDLFLETYKKSIVDSTDAISILNRMAMPVAKKTPEFKDSKWIEIKEAYGLDFIREIRNIATSSVAGHDAALALLGSYRFVKDPSRRNIQEVMFWKLVEHLAVRHVSKPRDHAYCSNGRITHDRNDSDAKSFDIRVVSGSKVSAYGTMKSTNAGGGSQDNSGKELKAFVRETSQMHSITGITPLVVYCGSYYTKDKIKELVDCAKLHKNSDVKILNVDQFFVDYLGTPQCEYQDALGAVFGEIPSEDVGQGLDPMFFEQ